MNKLFTTIYAGLCISACVYGQNGTADGSFNTTGKIDAAFETANSICTDKDQKILVLGHEKTGSKDNIYVTRYNEDGSVDNSFGVNGTFVNDLNDDYEHARHIHALSNGKYLISGQNSVGPYFRSYIGRLKNNGTVDSTFGTNGFLIIDPGVSCDAWRFELAASGSIYMSGYTTVSGMLKGIVWKVKQNGSIDNSFGDNGQKIINTNNNDERFFGMDLHGSTLALVGTSVSSGQSEGLVVLMDTFGTLKNNFNSGSALRFFYQSNATSLFDVVLRDNSLVTCGSYAGSANKALVLSLKDDGEFDSSFNGDGIYTDEVQAASQYSRILMNCEQEFFFGGNVTISGQRSFRVSKFDEDGNIDQDFGNSGHFTTRVRLNNNDEVIEAMTFAGDTGIIVAGRTDLGASTSRSGIVKIVVEECQVNTAIEDIDKVSSTSFVVYPNPSSRNNSISIRFSEDNIGSAMVSIYSADGKRAYFQRNVDVDDHKARLHNIDLNAGIYLVQVRTCDGRLMSSRLVID
jgi:uncharacterized delta-60 repeat protein